MFKNRSRNEENEECPVPSLNRLQMKIWEEVLNFSVGGGVKLFWKFKVQIGGLKFDPQMIPRE